MTFPVAQTVEQGATLYNNLNKNLENILVIFCQDNYPFILWTFPLTIKHNAMQWKIQNTDKTPVQIKENSFILIFILS